MTYRSLIEFIYGEDKDRNKEKIIQKNLYGVDEARKFLNKNNDVELSDEQVSEIAKIIKDDMATSHQAYYYITALIIAAIATLFSGLSIIIQDNCCKNCSNCINKWIGIVIGIVLIVCFVLILIHTIYICVSSNKTAKNYDRAMYVEIATILNKQAKKVEIATILNKHAKK